MSRLTHTKIPTAGIFGMKNAYSWNPIRGCANYSCLLHPKNKGECWAAKICNRMAGPWFKPEEKYLNDLHEIGKLGRRDWNHVIRQKMREAFDKFEPVWFQSQFDKQFPKRRSCILVGYQADLAFVSEEWISKIIAKIMHDNRLREAAKLPLHIFQFLTKKPSLYQRFEFPLNCWLGFTAMNQEMYNDGIMEMGDPFGKYFNGSNVWYSYLEPLEGPIIINKIESFPQYPHWIIAGGGPYPVNPDWVRSIRDQCQSAGVKFYFKGWGKKIWFANRHWSKREFNKMKKNNTMGWVYYNNEIDGTTWEQFPEV